MITVPAGGSRRTLYRQGKRLLSRLLISTWNRRADCIEPLVRRFLRNRSRGYLRRLVAERGFALAAATLLAAGAARAAPPVNLSDVAAGDGGFILNGIDQGDQSGVSVSGAGDVNGDGLADVIVGAWAADPSGGPSAGESYVVFGKSGGTAVNLSAVAAGLGGFIIYGINAIDHSGRSVGDAGDVNGDGLADLIVGAPQGDPFGTDSGESYVVFGKAGGTPINLSAVAAGNGGFVINGIHAGDTCGLSVSGAGDVNDDGLADVIVGATGADPSGNNGAGQSYVIFGKADGAAVNLSSVVAGIGGFVINGINPGTASGFSVSGAGDVNGDGLADSIVGTAAEASYVVFGKADGTAINLDSVAAGNGGFAINGIDPLDYCGRSVSGAGDVNGDGLADVIVGASGADPAGNGGAGESYVVFGKADGIAVDLSSVVAGIGGFAINGLAAGDASGASVSGAGDVNGDGLADVIVGAFHAGPPGSSSAGASYVMFGKADGTAVALSDIAAGLGGFVMNGADAGDTSGVSVSGAGDVNGDGLDDVIVGAIGGDPGGISYAGESYVVFSPVVRGDLDNDGVVGIVDMLSLLVAWGPCATACPPYCPGDLDGDCSVGIEDFLQLLDGWSL